MLHAPSVLIGIRPTFRPKPQSDAGCSICQGVRTIALRRQSNATASASPRCRAVLGASRGESAEASTSFQGAGFTPVVTADGALGDFPQSAGVYSIYSPDGQLQYIGLSRKVSTSSCTSHVCFWQEPIVCHAAPRESCLSAQTHAGSLLWCRLRSALLRISETYQI